ncbi:MAG: valine--tRNA ligase [Dissulfurispiraceae bacterium]|jgi:valyl-tRNA synthetase|nr:valine--tRNA ligase [Dissulfurispiraceae bacterium]
MNELNKSYEPSQIEDKWYELWENSGYFKPSKKADQDSFCIVIPPPNVTGSLHMGHALNATLQDILTRWKRMLGYNTLWLPGTDHAGIATQNVVERELAKQKISRHSIGRDAFIQKIWEWKSEYGSRITHQLKKMGASCDWSRERFTLDEGLSDAVREVFVQLYEEGLIYRDNRLINWCPRCHTALSDLEVEYEDTEGRIYYIQYPLSDSSGYLTVATTRPETMLGDTAVAVNPDDSRYKKFIGKDLKLPLSGRLIPVVADDAVDQEFGTGAVKVTPAHDFNDEAIGKRHGLPSLQVISEDGKMTAEAGKRYAGLDRYECRRLVLNDLKELTLLEGDRKHLHSVGHCYRCKTTIEPLQTIQWYVDVSAMSKEAITAVKDRKITIVPESWENNYYGWMNNIKDWCISRQIWWGHQIPVWYCPSCKSEHGSDQGDMIDHIFFEPVSTPDGTMLVTGTYSGLRAKGLTHEQIINNSKIIRVSRDVKPRCSRTNITECPDCGSKDIIRDPDVLDTWFSSALWPFSTLGWPKDTDDLRSFYPTSVLITGFDILFFWVARMIMMGLKFKKEVPFKDVYIHALVRDSHGQKMSKSRGNVVDPLDMIARFGADAFRFSLVAFAAQGRDIRFSEERVEGYRHFINKIWNASKFILGNLNNAGYECAAAPLNPDLPGRWIISRFNAAIEDVNRYLEAYRFNEAASSIYQFVWHEFCDWYIELSKPAMYGDDPELKKNTLSCLVRILKGSLIMLHPFTPFVTEEIWHALQGSTGSIMLQRYPMAESRDLDAESAMEYVLSTVSGIRSLRGELNIAPSAELEVYIKTADDNVASILNENMAAIKKMVKASEIIASVGTTKPSGSAVCVQKDMEIYLPVEGLLDIKTEVGRLQKEREKIEESIEFLTKKLSNEKFINSAPKAVVDKDRARFEELKEKSDKVSENIMLLEKIGS